MLFRSHRICAFEFSLDLSYYCDVVIADYNYMFDPRAHLVRYFEDTTYHPKILIDEVHNLISRSKDMYSSMISEEDIRRLRKSLNGYDPSIRSDCNKVIEKINSFKDFLVDKTVYIQENLDSELVVLLKNLLVKCDSLFSENKKINHKDEALEQYFKVLDFVQISSYYGPTHRFIAKVDQDICSVQMMCLDASDFLLETMHSAGQGVVLF